MLERCSPYDHALRPDQTPAIGAGRAVDTTSCRGRADRSPAAAFVSPGPSESLAQSRDLRSQQVGAGETAVGATWTTQARLPDGGCERGPAALSGVSGGESPACLLH